MNVIEALYPPETSEFTPALVRTFRERQGAEYVRKAAAIVKTAFEVTQQTESDTYKVYAALAANPVATPGALKLASVALQCLGRVEIRKQANTGPAGLWAVLRGVGGAAASGTAEAARLMALAGAAAGIPLGGGIWALRRGVTKEDQKLRELEIQRDTFGQLTSEVAEELKRRKMAPTPENTAAVVDYLT